MLRPLPLDIAGSLIPHVVGAAAFLTGRSFRRWPKECRIAVLTVALALVASAGLYLAGAIPTQFGTILSYVGGTTLVLGWVALLLLGVVWAVPGRSLSSGFLFTLAALAGCLIVIETGGRLWWRFCAAELWQHTADAAGMLRQSSSLTCSPAAAVMLLHRHGVAASEGELAYLAGTSLFGTDVPAICDALRAKVRPLGWRAEAQQTDYDTCARQGRPFLAHLHARLLGHAVLVERLSAEAVTLVDPADGLRRTMPRGEFEQVWDGTAIRVIVTEG